MLRFPAQMWCQLFSWKHHRSMVLLVLLFVATAAPVLHANEQQEPSTSQIAEAIIQQLGYLEANAHIEALKSAEGQRYYPDSSAELVASGLCEITGNDCLSPDGDGLPALPAVHDIHYVGLPLEQGVDHLGVNFQVRWSALDEWVNDGQYELLAYDVLLVDESNEYLRYRLNLTDADHVRAEHRVVFRHLAGHEYRVNVRPIYHDHGLNTDARMTRSSALTVTSNNALESYSSSWGGTERNQVNDQSSIRDLSFNNLNIPLYNCLIQSYSESDSLGSVTHIRCPDAGIVSLDGLSGFTGLQVLDLHNSENSLNPNQIDDIAQLIGSSNTAVSPSLSTLDLAGLNISSVSVLWQSLNTHLHKVDTLRYLDLSRTQLTTIPALSGLSNALILNTLNLSQNQLASIEPLSGLQALHYLYLDDNPLGNGVLASSSVLNQFNEMVSLSLNNVGLSGSVLADGLPDTVGILSLRDNQLMQNLLLPDSSSQTIAYHIDVQNIPGLSCSSVDSIYEWFSQQNSVPACVGSALLGQECLNIQFTGQDNTQCTAAAPNGFVITQQANGRDFKATWDALPGHWNVDFLRIAYRDSALNQAQILSASTTQPSRSFSLPNLNEDYYEFAVQSCHLNETTEQIRCGNLSSYIDPTVKLLKPTELESIPFLNDAVAIQWSYPIVPSHASHPDEFEVYPIFPVVGNPPLPIAFSFNSNNEWFTVINQLSEYPAGTVRVRACKGSGAERECGPHAELTVLSGPQTDASIVPPTSVNLSNSDIDLSHDQFRLSWADSNTGVDYYRVQEVGSGISGKVYAIEEKEFVLERYDDISVSQLQFDVQACQRDRENGDSCSEIRTSNALPLDIDHPIATPAEFCWFSNNAIGSSGGASVTLYWEYPKVNDVPEWFVIAARGVDDLAPLPGIENNENYMTHGYDRAQYDLATQTWFWREEVLAYAGEYGVREFDVRSEYGNEERRSLGISPIQLVNGVAVFDESSRCQSVPTQAMETLETTPIPGGPGDLQPGHFSDDPDHRGNGWRFYWANELRFDDVHQAFGISYDLIGFWYTYKLIDGEWSPVWYFTRMQLVQQDVDGQGTPNSYFEGALHYPRRGLPDLQVGTVKLYFEHENIENVAIPNQTNPSDNNQNAFIEVAIDHGDGMSGVLAHQIHDIALDHASIYEQPENRHDHYSGIYTTGELITNGDALADHDFFLVDWIEKELLSSGINFFDTNGDPIWTSTLICEQGNCPASIFDNFHSWRSFASHATATDPIFTVYPGNNPLAMVPDSWGDVSEHRVNAEGVMGRGHFINDGQLLDTDYNQSRFCASFSVSIGGRTAVLNTASTTNTCNFNSASEINKVANRHHIAYSIAGDAQATSCALSANNHSCEVRLTWFTDDNFPDTLPFYQRAGDANLYPITQLCPAASDSNGSDINADFVVTDYVCHIDQAGDYTFLLKNRATDVNLSTVIARSRALSITGISPSNNGVAFVPDSPINSTTAHTLATNLEHDATVGAMNGQAAVSGGAATYQIPINIPPGRRGMQPSIALNYHSRSGNGTVGMGWSLSVGSSIHRCPQTAAQDGRTLGVSYQNTDRLCLDGQRLMRVNAGNYWDDGGIFRTEIDQFVQVRLIGSQGGTSGQQVQFEVQTRDNKTRLYGSATGARVEPFGPQNVVSAWLLSEEKDPQGNRIDYVYTSHGQGEQLISHIDYTGFGATTGNRRINFDYENRCVGAQCDDSESWGTGAYQTQQTRRLNRIRTCIDKAQCDDVNHAGIVRDYHLNYQISSASGRLLLNDVQECAWLEGSVTCLPKTEFTWGDEQAQYSMTPWQIKRDGLTINVVDQDPMALAQGSLGARFDAAGDFDGDGTREFQISDGQSRYLVSLDAEGRERWRVAGLPDDLGGARSAGTTSMLMSFVNEAELQAETLQQMSELDDKNFNSTNERTAAEDEVILTVESEFILKALPASAFSDLDNDGRVDFYGAIEDSSNPGIYHLHFGHWKGVATSGTTTDDYFDLIATDLPLTVVNGVSGNYVADTPIWGDVTGDGLVDALLYKSREEPGCDASNSGTLQETAYIELWVNQGFSSSENRYQFTLLNNGNDGALYVWPCVDVDGITIRERGSRPSLQDWNGDGVLDIAIASQIPDLFIAEYPVAGGDVTISDVIIPTGYQSATLRYLIADTSSAQVQFVEQALWGSSGVSLGMHSDPRRTFVLPIDINGDGFQDYLSIANNDETVLNPGEWYLQLNRGGLLADPVAVAIPAELSQVFKTRYLDGVNPIHTPQYGNLIKSIDWDTDGRTELLIPRKVHQGICLYRQESAVNPDNGVGSNVFMTYCPGHLDAGVGQEPQVPPSIIGGSDTPARPDHNVGGIHFNGLGHRDASIYEMDIVEFEYDALSNQYQLVTIALPATQPLLAGVNSQVVDINGDGIVDIVTPFGCQEFPQGSPSHTNPNTHTPCLTPTGFGFGSIFNFPDIPYSEDFHCRYSGNGDGIDCGNDGSLSQRGYRVTQVQQNDQVILDLLLGVKDGLKNEAHWHYAPLSSNVERTDTDIPLYTVPNRDLGVDYLRFGENDHFYFSSSMLVVSSFEQSNGLWEQVVCDMEISLLRGCAVGSLVSVPLLNSTIYGYEEAVANHRGRGFQGFRKIVSEQRVTNTSSLEDDHHNDLRTVSLFHQIFPLAGELEASYTQSALTPYSSMQDRETNAANANLGGFKAPDEIYSLNTTEYACRSAGGVERAHCDIGTGSINQAQAEIPGVNNHGVYHPIAAASTAEQYEPNDVSYRYFREETQWAYDAYGNVLIRNIDTENLNSSNNILLKHSRIETNTYTNDPNTWWIGRLDQSTVSTSSHYPAMPEPVNGLSAIGFDAISDMKSITQQYQYNGATERQLICQYQLAGAFGLVSPECDPNQAMNSGVGKASRTITNYDQYGNVQQVTLDASQLTDQRFTQSIYGAEGYFPAQLINAEGHQSATNVDAREGLTTLTSDVNQMPTRIEYDAFGREVRRWSPMASNTGFDAIGSAGSPNHYAPRSMSLVNQGSACGANLPEGAQFCQWQITDGAPIVWQAIDSLGRVLESRVNGYQSTGQSSSRVYRNTDYNGRGQVVFESAPQYGSLSTVGTTYEYDEIGRVILKSQPSSVAQPSGQLLYTHYQPSGLTTTIHVTNQIINPGSCVAALSGSDLDTSLCVQRTYAQNGWLLSTVDAHGFATRFWYDGQGNTKLIADPDNNLTGANYNDLAQRADLFDPNMGHWQFDYNGVGEVIYQQDAKSQTVDYLYDRLGRQIVRVARNVSDPDISDIEDRWIYDPLDAIGSLESEQRNISLHNGSVVTPYQRDYRYDDLSRPAGYSVHIDPYYYASTAAPNTSVLNVPASYNVDMEYDRYFARLKSLTYPQSRLRLYQAYDVNGYLQREGDSNDQSIAAAYRHVMAMNANGQVTHERFGNGMDQFHDYLPDTFQMETTSLFKSGVMVSAYTYEYDLFGNLKRHEKLSSGTLETESFVYDHLHRLTRSQRDGLAAIDYDYDSLGNFVSKSDFAGSYQYLAGKPNAVSHVTLASDHSAQYSYDANGNLVSGNSSDPIVGQMAVFYDAYNKPFRTERNGNRSEFWYGSNDQRYYQLDSYGLSTVYIDKLYEQKGPGKHQLYLGDYAVFNVNITNPSETGLTYLHKDRLGSMVEMSDEQGNLITNANRGFDPFGKPREGNWTDSDQNDNTGQIGDLNRPDLTTRGFTGHEQLNNVALTHMNGRAYDYNLGRFLSVDPFIQFPSNSQSLNPYSYILNNPLSGTDPSGYVSCDESGQECNIGIDEIESIGVTDNGDVVVSTSDGNFSITNKDQARAIISYSANAIFDSGVSGTPSMPGFSEIKDWYTSSERDANNTISRAAFTDSNPGDPLKGVFLYALSDKSFGLADGQLSKQDQRDIESYLEMVDQSGAGPLIDLISLKKLVSKAVKSTKRLLKGGTKRSCSFAAGTLVSTIDGFAPIETVAEGDYLLAKDELTGELAYRMVVDAYHHDHDDGIVMNLRSDMGEYEEVVTTSEHPFYVIGAGFVPAGELEAGQDISSTDGSVLVIESIDKTPFDLVAYNFEVEEFHTYFVGEQRAWVHNACDSDGPNSPAVGGGAELKNLSPGEQRRIQNAANRSGADITVVGSQTTGSKPFSDFDFVIEGGTSRSRSRIRNSLPSGPPGTGDGSGRDFHKGPVDKGFPHITFKPKPKG